MSKSLVIPWNPGSLRLPACVMAFTRVNEETPPTPVRQGPSTTAGSCGSSKRRDEGVNVCAVCPKANTSACSRNQSRA